MQDAEDEVGWSNTRVAYYWNDIDETGEKELTDFEELFSDRIEAISRIICEKLRKGEWDRAYILSDHGFVSLPKHVDIDDLHPPDNAEQVTRRWVAGTGLDDDAHQACCSTRIPTWATSTMMRGSVSSPIQSSGSGTRDSRMPGSTTVAFSRRSSC